MTNSEIDSKIVEAIKTGRVRNMDIHFSDKDLRDLHFRVIDHRLQSLRKGGHIKYAAKTGWSLTEEK